MHMYVVRSALTIVHGEGMNIVLYCAMKCMQAAMYNVCGCTVGALCVHCVWMHTESASVGQNNVGFIP